MFYSEAANQPQPLTMEDINKSIEELKKKDVGMYKAMALSSIDIIPNAMLPSRYWCIHCSPDVYTKIQIEIDKMNCDEN